MLKIEFEGTDCAGKTTGLKHFIAKAKERGLSVVETREVGNPHIESCVKMRQLVLDPANKLSGESMELVFSAMRIESDLWLKNLQKSESPPNLVVSDRGFFSHLAYGDNNTSLHFTKVLFSDLMEAYTTLPDVVIYFSVDTDVAKKRMVGRGQAMDVIELKGPDFQAKVRTSFEYYLNLYSENEKIKKLFIIDANQDIAGVQKQLDSVLNSLLARSVP